MIDACVLDEQSGFLQQVFWQTKTNMFTFSFDFWITLTYSVSFKLQSCSPSLHLKPEVTEIIVPVCSDVILHTPDFIVLKIRFHTSLKNDSCVYY